jgi:hypothetical protein
MIRPVRGGPPMRVLGSGPVGARPPAWARFAGLVAVALGLVAFGPAAGHNAAPPQQGRPAGVGAIGVTRAVGDKRGPIARQLARLTLRTRRYEAGSQEPVTGEIRRPLAILDIGRADWLAAPHRPHLRSDRWLRQTRHFGRQISGATRGGPEYRRFLELMFYTGPCRPACSGVPG